MKRIFVAIMFLGLSIACSSDDGGDPTPLPPDPDQGTPEEPTGVNFERSTMLSNWADNIIIPSYEAFANEMDAFKAAFEVFRATADTASLTALRDTWLTAYKRWQHISMFEFGPAENIDYRLNMNIYPTNVERIEGFVALGTYDLSLPSNRSAKGFPALDYLLNGLATDDETIVAKYNGSDKEGLMDYFEAILTDMSAMTNTVLTDWKENYRDTFVANDGSSASASVDRLVNDYVFYYEKFLRAGKMGIPLGVFSGVQAPNTIEALHVEGLSNDLFQEGLQAFQDFFNGKHYHSDTTGESLASYLVGLGRQDLMEDINAQLNSARIAVNGLQPFNVELQEEPAVSMLTAYDEVQKTVSLLKVDMFSAMSISVDYVDADGD